MARAVTLKGPWRVTCRMPGGRAAGADECLPDLNTPDPLPVQMLLIRAGLMPDPRLALGSLNLEWTGLREWTYSTTFATPEEPAEGHSERYTLCLTPQTGRCAVYVNGAYAGHGAGRAALDITGILRAEGENALDLVFEPSDAVMGRPPLPVTGMLSAPVLRCTSFMTVDGITVMPRPFGASDGRVSVALDVTGFGAGRYTFKYRVLMGDELAANIDIQEKLRACSQRVVHTIEMKDIARWIPGQGGGQYRLMLTVVRGGVRCDMAEAAFGFSQPELRDALYIGGKRVFAVAASLAPPYPYSEDMSSFWTRAVNALMGAGVNLLRIPGDMPVDAALADACDRSGMLLWKAFSRGECADALNVLAGRPCAALISLGEDAADDAPEALTHDAPIADAPAWRPPAPLEGTPALPTAHDANAASTRPVSATSEPTEDVSAPFAALRAQCASRLPHVPLIMGGGSFERICAVGASRYPDALMQSRGMPLWPPDAASALYRHQGTSAPGYLEAFGDVPDAFTPCVFSAMRFLQAARIRRGVLRSLKWDSSGILIENALDGYPRLFSPALLEHDGAPRPALFALSMARDTPLVALECPERVRPGIAIPLRAVLLGASGDVALSITVHTHQGVPLLEESADITPQGSLLQHACAPFNAPDAPCVLIVRVTAALNGSQHLSEAAICVGDASASLSALSSLPPVALTWSETGGLWRIGNDSPCAAVALTVTAPGIPPPLLCAMLLPWEQRPVPVITDPGRCAVEAVNARVTVKVV